MSKVCDLCNMPTDVDPSRVYSPSEFRSLAANGLQPDESMLSMFTAMGLQRNQALAHWKSKIVGTSTTDWLLCPSCAAKANRYRSSGGTSSRPSLQTSQSTDGKPSGGGCFIATACYGDYDAPEVRILRRFRDNVLLKSPGGHRVVDLYYRTSPPLAQLLERHPIAAGVIRAMVLNPITSLVGRLHK